MIANLIWITMNTIIEAFAYWHRDRWLYVLAGFSWVLFGFFYSETSLYLSIIIVVFGVYNFFKAALDKRQARA